jgi:predicted acylesterase/phospholipase RssA
VTPVTDRGLPATALGGSSLLAGASRHAVDELLAGARDRIVPAREWLFRAGESADACFLVGAGRLEVVLEGEEGERVVRVVGPGTVLGELALLAGGTRSASVRALRDSRLLELDAERFLALLDSDPAFGAALARELARQLQASGGLELPPARVAVLAVTGDDPAGFGAELARALGRWGSVAVLDGSALDESGFAEAAEAAEAAHGHVVLVDRGDAGAWSRFVRRQADRVLVVARPGRTPEPFPGCELVLVGVPAGTVAGLLDSVGPRSHHVVAAGESFGRGVEQVARRLTGRSLGLVFSGGGARGFAHVGVLETLAEAGFAPDRIGGCSMGAFIAGLAATGAPEFAEERCRAELVRRSPFNDYTLPRVALIRSRKAGAMLERVFGEGLVEELERPLFTVSADLLSSRIVVHRRGRLVDAIGASMSIPGVAPPVRRPGRLLVDGGVLNNLPVDHMHESGEGPIVAVDVIRRLGEPGADEEPSLPSITETLARATVLGSVERAERNRELASLVIAPDVQSIGLREWSAFERAVEAGRREAAAVLEAGGAARLRELLDAPAG